MMDSRLTADCRTKKQMDAKTVWQWRIMCGKKYSQPDQFHYCNEIGLEFNVAANAEKKLDLQLVTNGVILEVCDFAKTVSKSKNHFITNILENNFDLGLENDQQRVDFTYRILRRVKDLNKTDKHEVFTLFDTLSEPECASNNGLNLVSKSESVMVEKDDNDDNKPDKFKCSQATSEEYMRTESFSDELDGEHVDDGEHEDEFKFSAAHSTKEMEDDVLPPLFPCCEEIGLNLDTGTKQSLDPSLLTKGVMLELLNFTNILTASFSQIALDILEHNFELDLKSKQAKNRVLSKLSGLQKRRKQLSKCGSNTISEFKNEPFSLQTYLCRQRRGSALSNEEAKRCKETDTFCHYTNLCSSGKAEDDCCNTCAPKEFGLDSDKVRDPGNTGNQNHLQNLINSDILKESESSCVDGFVPFLTSSDISSSLTTPNPSINSPFTSQSDRKGLCGGDKQVRTPGNASNKCDLEEEDMGTADNLWKLRANRVEEIFSPLNKFFRFKWSRKFGLEFNIGYGPKRNINIDSLTSPVLLEIARFALEINASQKDFIMEILEYNFDLGLKNQRHRDIFAFEIMNRVRLLRSCEDAVKFSNEVFELSGPLPSVNVANQRVDRVSPELGSISRMGKCDGAPVCLDSHAETKEHISCKSLDLYPSCKEIGLKLHVIYGQSSKKLEINKLTNAAMTEVTNFAEKLCGTFEQICCDIIRHNCDLDLQSGDSDLARSIFARITAAKEERNLNSSKNSFLILKGTRKDTVVEKLDYQDDPSLDACNTSSSQTAIMDQDVGRSTDIEHKNELNLKLWKLRANHIQHILSIPHEEHCPLYSYSRCKKLGIDFNVGSGVQQNLDPKFLTNGIVMELKTFATALTSATKYFITEILEYNFNLNFKDELCRSVFAQQTMENIRVIGAQAKIYNAARNKMPFKLPGTESIQVPSCDKLTFCPKCYQDRKHKLCQSESNLGHPHTMTDTVSAEANGTAQTATKNPFPTIEETIMDSYPFCKKIGLKLCVNKDQPKNKLDKHILTRGVVNEVIGFAKKLSGTSNKVISDVLEHNFSIDMPCLDFALTGKFCRAAPYKDGGLASLDDVFVIRPISHRQPSHVRKLNEASERKEAVQKRKLALQTKEERATLPCHDASVVKSKTNQSKAHIYPICTEIGLALDVTEKSQEKEKLNLNLLTTGVIVEIHKYASQKKGHYFPGTVFDILDYNFDLSSQHYRRWEFSLAAASKIQREAKRWRKKRDGPYEVFKLPFVFPPKTSSKKCSQGGSDNKRNEGSCVHQVRYHSDVHHINFHEGVTTVEEPWSHDEDTKSPTDPWRMNVQMNEGNIQIKKEEYDPQYCEIKAEPDNEEYYHSYYEVKTESNTRDVEHLVPGEPAGSLGVTGNQIYFQKLTSLDITRESRSTCLVIGAPFSSTTDISSTAVNPNENTSFASQASARGFCEGEEPTQIIRNAPNECEQEGRGTWNKYTNCSEEFALNSGVTDLANASNQENLENSTSSDVQRESELSCLVVCVPFPTIINVSSTLPAENSNENPLFASPADDRRSCGGEAQTQTLKNAVNECDMEQEKIRKGDISYPQEEFALISDEDKKSNEGSCVHQVRYHSDVHHINFLGGVKTVEEPSSHDEDKKSPTDPWRMNVQMRSIGCGSPLQGNTEMKKEEPDPQYCDIKAEPDTEEYYHPHYDEVKTESNTGDVEHLIPGKPAGSLGTTGNQIHFQNLTSSDITRESRSTCLDIGVPVRTTTDFSSTLLAENSDENLFACHSDERQLCVGEEQTQTLKNASNECVMEQEEIRAENNYSYPPEEFELTSNKVTDSGNAGNQDHSQSSTISGSSNEPEPSGQIVCVPLPTTTDVSATLLAGNSYVDPLFASQLDQRGSEETQAPKLALKECGIEQEEMGSEHDMWKFRSNRVEQILSALNKEFGPFNKSKKVGLEFNVGLCPKQNINVDSLTSPVLLEIARFALAINSSQEDFIMEILEYNFDLGLQNQHHRNIFACQIMNRIRQLRSCEDTVELSNEVFELPGPMPSVNTGNQSGGSVIPELGDISKMDKCYVAPMCLDSYAESEEHILSKSVNLYPSCKEMGLKLHVNKSQPTKKMEIHKLTKAVMSEVTNFAEKLCGTFEQICLDIIRHNFDLDLQSGDSDPARNILFQIRAAMEQKNLSGFTKAYKKKKSVRKDIAAVDKLDNLDRNVDACSASAITDRNVGSSADSAHQNAYNLKLWKLRANQIQQILSMPHQEHCPLYSYSRCNKLGIDFNVGSGEKLNLDPRLLTNGIMVELNTFATALLSARKYFITEILEHNFDLDLKNELYRRAFAQKTMDNITTQRAHKRITNSFRMKIPFKLPDVRCMQELTHNKTTYCPKCCKDQIHEVRQDEFEPGHLHHPHPQPMMDTVSADVNCTTQEPSKDLSCTFLATEGAIMDSYPNCKAIGLNLCVHKDQPNDKLDPHVLTRGIMMEVAAFAKKLCGTNHKVINDILEHNFNIVQSRDINPSLLFQREMKQNDGGLAWFEKVFVFQQYIHRPPGYVSKVKREAAMHRGEWKVAIKKRKLALQTKEENAALPSHNIKRIHQSMRECYPSCTKIGLDLDVTLKSGNKEKLDLKLLTTAVVLEIHKFANQKVGHYYPRTVFNILDCNFDLSSQHYRRWEFSIATASKVQTTVEQYCKTQEGAEEVFQLPFVLDPKASLSEKRHIEKGENFPMGIVSESESSAQGICAPLLTSTDVSYSLPTVNSDANPLFENQSGKTWLSGVEEQTQTQKTVSSNCDMVQEKIGTENYYTWPIEESDLDSDEVTDSGNDGNQDHSKPPEVCSLKYVPNKCDIKQEEMGTEQNMWKLRSDRVEQILSTLNEEFGPFNESKKIGLEFNVGFSPKQSISVDSLTDAVLLELVQFTLAINSSTKDFIMEILEHNFDLCLQNEHHRNVFAYEFMNRVRQLRNCDDAVKFSNEVFELPGCMSPKNMASQSVDSVCPEHSSILKRDQCDFSPAYPSGSHVEIKEHISHKSMDLYPSCKEIGLMLHVKKGQPKRKLEINKLTNAAMTEVTNFVEKLCGTFEQICLDILRHNFDLDLQSGDCDPAINILARIPAVMEQTSTRTKPYKNEKDMRKDISTVEKVDCQNSLNSDACSTGSSEAAATDQIEGSCADIEQKNQLNLMLWKLRASHIQRILSIPHKEHCPLYSYSRCKKLGVDFNVGSTVRQNLDPKLLTNGIMVELITLATALLSARRYFVTEILEHNFHFDFKNELHRCAFAQKIRKKIAGIRSHFRFLTGIRKNMPFELPDMGCIDELMYDETAHCSKCYQEQNHKICNESDPGHVHHPQPQTTKDTVSTDANCTTQKPSKDLSSIVSAMEESIMDSSPLCKEIGLKLCVDRDQPKKKLDTYVLTRGMMVEVVNFANRLCGGKSKIIRDLLEHNFNIDTQGIDILSLFQREMKQNDGGLSWLEKVFVTQQHTPVRPPGHVGKLRQEAAVLGGGWKEALKKRRMALGTKEEKVKKVTLPSHYCGPTKAKKNRRMANCYPICTEIGLELDVTVKRNMNEKLDLRLLTTAVVSEIHAFATQKEGHYYPRTVFEILDYNFDLSSQHYRRWEFSLAIASKVQATVQQYCEKQVKAEEVFELPFVFHPKATSADISSSLPTANSNVNPSIGSQSDESDLEYEEMVPENYYMCPLEESDLDLD